MKDAFIAFQRCGKHYGSHVVLEKLNASVQEGEFVTMVGTSGCGKSTFLKMLLGTETQTTGKLLFNGQPIVAEPSEDRGVVFQKYSVFPHLSVRDNVALGREFAESPLLGKLFGQKRRQALAEADQWLEAVGLAAARDKYPHELSGGMQQRLAIAQALIKHPKVLLLDEPFGALDPGIRKDMHALILKLWKENNLTIFMVTHDLQEAFYLGTRLWVFDWPQHEAQDSDQHGATITFDLPIEQRDELQASDLEFPENESPVLMEVA
ncbi:ABC transporter ATP-binding protein [uncultured Endozoicomonas sp.]|uniref:ABC transporter ATP-binding protein n=1 Tax=uncultured Endozoicomonas sp. TaxID=432652 RepID=UPI00262AE8E6|nr:ABC transporter ATP-binding protein [uncultured Endozoicomonas sp.]